MKIDLCKIFGVEEGEEFKIGTHENPYRIYNNSLQCLDTDFERWKESVVTFNYAVSSKIIKLPQKKEFTDEELAIMRSLPKKYKWMVRDRYDLCLYKNKPEKIDEDEVWDDISGCILLEIFDHLFQNIQCEDEEPVFIDDYVER